MFAIARHYFARDTENHQETNKNQFKRHFSSLMFWIELNWHHLWPYVRLLHKCCQPFQLGDLLTNRRYLDQLRRKRRVSLFMPKCKMPTSVNCKGCAKTNIVSRSDVCNPLSTTHPNIGHHLKSTCCPTD